MRVVQMTDMHIVPRGEYWMGDPQTNVHERLKRVVAAINLLNPQPDLVVATGDNIDSPSVAAAYEELAKILKPLKAPLRLIPGNHDDRQMLKSVFPNSKESFFVFDHPQARLIGLDSLVSGKDYGELSLDQLNWLKNTLNSRREIPALIFVHHFPVRVGIEAFDQIRLRNADELEEILKFYPQVIGTVCGHFHNQFSSQFAGKPLFIGPSVAPNYHFESSQAKHPQQLKLEPPQFVLHQIHGFNWSSQVVSVVRADRTLNFLELKGRR